jgi:hypothetical protein
LLNLIEYLKIRYQHIILKRLYLIILAIVSSYYLTVFLFSINFPISDDFALIDFINHYIKTNNLLEKIALFFAQHNEHKIATTKLLFFSYYKLVGPLNFKYLCLIGNLSILGLYLILAKQARDVFITNNLILLVIACLLFQYGSAESMLSAMASISNYSVLLFALLTMDLLKSEKADCFITAIICAVLASFSQGNGLVVFIIAAMYLLSQKRYRIFSIWILIAAVVFYFYFKGYKTSTHQPDPLLFINNLWKILIFMFAFMGSAFGVGGSNYPLLTKVFLVPTVAIGLFVFIVTVFFFYMRKYKDGNILIWINLFIIFTSFLTATSRIDFGLSQALVSRYHINSSLIIISTIILLYQQFTLQKPLKISWPQFSLKYLTTFSMLYLLMTFPLIFFFSYKIYRPARDQEIIFPVKAKAVEILEKAEVNGVYFMNKK